MIKVIDIGFGNVNSVRSWLHNSQVEYSISSNAEFAISDIVLVPGVGSADFVISTLKKYGMFQVIKKHIMAGGKYVGICVGMQILFEQLSEGPSEGLGIFQGSVIRLSNKSITSWNKINFEKKLVSKNWHKGFGLKSSMSGRVFNNHSYGIKNYNNRKDEFHIFDKKHHFFQVVGNDNVLGFQFHPEKSQNMGLELGNFLRYLS